MVDMQSLKKYKDNYWYILTVIDCFSRRAAARPLKNKTGKAVAQAFDSILRELKPKTLKYVQTDKGNEFLAREVQSLLASKNIEHFTSNSPFKAALVERLNRTLQGKMYKYFTARNTVRWVNALPDFITSYNAATHRALGTSHNKVTQKNTKELYQKMYGAHLRKAHENKTYKFQKGNTVRLTAKGHIFRKGYLPKWEKEKFEITHQLDTYPPTYKISAKSSGKQMPGIWYEPELQKIL